MKITLDKRFGVMYIKLTENEVANTTELADSVAIDLDKEGKIVGIELLNVKHLPDPLNIEYTDITTQPEKHHTHVRK